MKIEVFNAQWGAGDDVFPGGVHEDVHLTSELAPLVAGAAAAGAIAVLEATEDEQLMLHGHVESDEISQDAYDTAMANGDWRTGQLQQFISEAEERLANPDLELPDHTVAWLEKGIADAHAELADIAEGADS